MHLLLADFQMIVTGYAALNVEVIVFVSTMSTANPSFVCPNSSFL